MIQGKGIARNVSVIIPCFNEGGFIEACLGSIINNDYSADRVEILVIDGMSTDGSRTIVERYCREHDNVRCLDNARRITSCALNIGIRNAKNELILWLSAHNVYNADYISSCVAGHARYDADCIGGGIETESRSAGLLARTVALVLSSSFGVGNSHFRTGTDRPMYVDAVFGGCYRKDVFERVGGFNEDLVRGQDIEMSLRIRNAGMKTLLLPELKSTYYARSDIISFCRHNCINGLWAILPFRYAEKLPISVRHIIPLIFFVGIVATVFASFFSNIGLAVFIVFAVLYTIISFCVSWVAAKRAHDYRYLLVMPFVFFILHVTYGAGSAIGIIRLIFSGRFWSRLFKPVRRLLRSGSRRLLQR